MLVRNLMTAPAVTAPPTLSLPDAVNLMPTRGLWGMPVMRGRPSGLLTVTDVLHDYARPPE